MNVFISLRLGQDVQGGCEEIICGIAHIWISEMISLR